MWADALLAIPVGVILGEWLGYDFGAYFGGDPTDGNVMQQAAGQGVGVMSVGIVIVMGLWLALSSGILSGSERARSTGILLFVVATVTLILGGYVTLGFTGFSWQASWRWLPLTLWGYLVVFAYWAVALTVVILLARRDSLEFFAARTAARKTQGAARPG